MAEARDMELLDWFAGQALNALLTNPKTPDPGSSPFTQHADSLAQQAYGYAEAMLRQRDNQPTAP